MTEGDGGRGATLLKAVTGVLVLLVLASVVYAVSMIVRYWGSTGV